MKSNKEIILHELEIWKDGFPKVAYVLENFAKKIILELELQGGGEK